jgi:hypothetical protein
LSIYSDAKVYADLLPCFDSIGRLLNYSRSQIPYPNDDARHVALGGMQQVVAGYAMGFASMIYGRTQAQIIESFGKNNLSEDGARRCVEDAWKNGMLTLFHFKIDVLFQNLLRALGIHKDRGFEPMTKALLAEVGITDDKARDVLAAATYIRNSLHNNGMHRGRSNLILSLQDMDYSFEKGKRVDCAGWGHDLAVMHESILVIDQILATEKVKAIKTPFEDDYAKDPNDDHFDVVDYSINLT